MANRLESATSPYLLQHKDNPVDWWEWGNAAFAEARRRDVPILLSIGYAACHWCHVMAHESFEDSATAALMNAHFVSVKVDREERPDVDAVYMGATQALTGHGGWPMTVFLTHEGKPFYAGTYFPPRPAHGMPAFAQLLTAIHETWRDRRDEVEDAGARIAAGLSERPGLTEPGEAGEAGMRGGGAPDVGGLEAVVAQAVRALLADEDRAHGGFGGAPKFPPSMDLEFLIRHAARTGDGDALAAAGRTLHAMARSGMYDQLAGGFARYAVDRAWVVPHFEKMLYDNALLARVYLHWWRLTGEPTGARVAVETCDWMLSALRTAQGGLASSLDADTAGVEGQTYAWTPQQLVDVLGAVDGAWAGELLRVTPAGTFEHGSSTLQLDRDPWADRQEAQRWSSARAALLAARDSRPQPSRDDKVVAAWNGLAIAALAETGALLDRPDLVEAARAVAELLLSVHLVDGPPPRVRRVSKDGVAGAPAGVLEDYADLAEGLLTLHGVTGEPAWLQQAGGLLDTVLDQFADGSGGFFDTATDATDAALSAVRRPQDPTDNAYPSGASAAAGALLGYAALTGSARHRESARAALGPVARVGARAPRAFGWALSVVEALLDGPREIAVVGADGDAGRAALHRLALAATAPGAVVSVGVPQASGVPLLADRPARGGAATAYVCRGFVCDAPTTDPGVLARSVGARH